MLCVWTCSASCLWLLEAPAGSLGSGVREGAAPDVGLHRLVSNLDYAVSEQDLNELFANVGPLTSCTIDFDARCGVTADLRCANRLWQHVLNVCLRTCQHPVPPMPVRRWACAAICMLCFACCFAEQLTDICVCSGRSVGTAEVLFKRPEDAQRAIEQYNNVALDGKLLKLQAEASARPQRCASLHS